MNVTQKTGGILITDCDIDLYKTFDCGQCFRFDSTGEQTFTGVALGRLISIKATEGGFYIDNMSCEEFEKDFVRYFDLNRDYAEIHTALEKAGLHQGALQSGKGIRILRQDPWEALCSFIISQNNNIPRIKKIISSLCVLLGNKIDDGVYSFPTAVQVATAGVEGLAPIKAGFRAKYIIDAAERVADGRLELEKLSNVPLSEAISALCTVKGVGPKVASCVALFGLGHTDAFPIDVWIKRVIDKYYGNSFSPDSFGQYAGIAQQYLFYHERYLSK